MNETRRLFAYDRLKIAVLDYLSELDRPDKNQTMILMLRNKLRSLVGAPDDPQLLKK